MLQVFMEDGSRIQLEDGQTPQIDWWNVIWAKASGAELNLIISNGYPHHRKNVQIYVGDTARQIVANWRSED